MDNEIAFLIGPLAFFLVFGSVALFLLVRERAEDRKRKVEEARRNQTKPVESH